jgi:hypothetical protein
MKFVQKTTLHPADLVNEDKKFTSRVLGIIKQIAFKGAVRMANYYHGNYNSLRVNGRHSHNVHLYINMDINRINVQLR